jgi:quercetin 2,3-dioxygenase
MLLRACPRPFVEIPDFCIAAEPCQRAVIRPGEVQRMSAGAGISHSEFNHSKTEPVHFLQIWIIPAARGLRPSYEQKRFGADLRHNRFLLVGDPDGTDGALTIHQDARLYVADVEEGQSVARSIGAGRYAWLQVVRGIVELDGGELREGDGVGLVDERSVEIAAQSDAELLWFDLA